MQSLWESILLEKLALLLLGFVFNLILLIERLLELVLQLLLQYSYCWWHNVPQLVLNGQSRAQVLQNCIKLHKVLHVWFRYLSLRGFLFEVHCFVLLNDLRPLFGHISKLCVEVFLVIRRTRGYNLFGLLEYSISSIHSAYGLSHACSLISRVLSIIQSEHKVRHCFKVERVVHQNIGEFASVKGLQT